MSDSSRPADDSRAAQGPEGPPKPPESPQSQPAKCVKDEEPAASQDDRKSQPDPSDAPPRRGGTVVARYGGMRYVGEFRHNLDPPPAVGKNVVLRTDRGVELGKVLAVVGPTTDDSDGRRITQERLAEYIRANGPDYHFRDGGKVLRLANRQDIIDHRHLNSSAGEEAAFCREQIRQLKLKMKLVAVEHLLGGERIVFYFSAEARVDFRELVRLLASQYRTRIEMRQVGARDEARLAGDYERCGRRCCCQEFLKNLKPVSMRMAKTQKATLDPSKISGRCGRLMCCLRYEDAGYEELRKNLPRKNTWVRTEGFVGRVASTQILTQLVRLTLADRKQVVVANEDIIERDVEPPEAPLAREKATPGKAPKPPARPKPVATSEKEPMPEAPASAAAPQVEQAGDSSQPARADSQAPTAKKKRRRRRNPPSRHRGKQQTSAQTQNAPAGGSSKKKRRRRRKK